MDLFLFSLKGLLYQRLPQFTGLTYDTFSNDDEQVFINGLFDQTFEYIMLGRNFSQSALWNGDYGEIKQENAYQRYLDDSELIQVGQIYPITISSI